jgi:hypothetical protein
LVSISAGLVFVIPSGICYDNGSKGQSKEALSLPPFTSMSASTSSHHAHDPALSDQAIIKTFVQTVTRAFYDPPAIILLDQLLKKEVYVSSFGLALLASSPPCMVEALRSSWYSLV